RQTQFMPSVTAVPTQRIAVLSDTVSFAAAAALPVAGLTALRTLRHGAPLLGKRVLITGAAGGGSHLAGQPGVCNGNAGHNQIAESSPRCAETCRAARGSGRLSSTAEQGNLPSAGPRRKW